LLVFIFSLLFISFTGEWNGSDKLASAGGYTSPGLHSPPPLGKVARAGADFPPNREHYSRHIRWKLFLTFVDVF